METCIKPNLNKLNSYSESDFFDEFIDDVEDFVNNEENVNNCWRNLTVKIRNILYKLVDYL